MNLFQRIKGFFNGPFNGAQEGAWRGPFLGIGEFGNGFQLSQTEDGWQRHLNVDRNAARSVAPVYTCVMLYARAASQCEAKHMRKSESTQGFEPVATSPASRILRRPNAYETFNQLIFNTIAAMLFEGECLWVAIRDDRFAVTAVHRIPRGNWTMAIDPETKEVFYSVGSNNELFVTPDYVVSARDVVHFRQHCPRHPLMGESPITAASLAVGINVALNSSQMQFFANMNRPSGVLSTDVVLNKDQIRQLREAFNEQSKTLAQGGIPVLGGGLKFQPMNISQSDSQLIEQQKLSNADIARVFGVPSALVSDTAGPQGGTEALISHWLSVGLGAVLETIERSIDNLFDFGANDYIQLDPQPLLRVDFASRIDGLAKAVQAGILSPQEARAKEGYGHKPGADELFLQQQMVSISMLGEMHAATIANKLTPAAKPVVDQPEQPEPDKPDAPDTPDKGVDAEVTKALVVDILQAKKRIAA